MIKYLFIVFYFATVFFNFCLAQQATPVEVDLVTLKSINQTIPFIARVESKKVSNISSSVQGLVEEVFVSQGDYVERGDLLANVDTKRYKILLNIARANVDAAIASLESKKADTLLNSIEMQRMKSLEGSGAYNLSKFENLENKNLVLLANEANSSANLEVMRNREKIAEQNYRRSSIKADFAGKIEFKNLEQGEFLTIGEPVLRLISESLLEIEADIPVNRARVLSVGNKVQVSTSDNYKFYSEVRALGVKVNTATRTLPVFLSLIEDEKIINKKLYIGENLNIFIPIGPDSKSLTVHKDGILKREDISLVYIVKDNIVEIRPVLLGDGVGDRFIVLEGLEIDDMVVIKGNERLRPGQKISILNNNID